MRLFELFTLIFSTGTFYALCFLKNKRLFLYLLFLASICCVLQYFFEGGRWQFLPILYSLPLMYIFYKLNKASFVAFQSLFIGFFLLVGFVLLTLVPVFNLPEPNGFYHVGTEIFHWTDSTRSELFTPEDTTDYREIIVQVWYPSKKHKRKDSESYLDHINLRSSTMAKAAKIPAFLPEHLKYIKTNSFKGIKCDITSAPILIFSHGITGSRHLHQNLFEFLSSRGYIIFAPDHTYDANITIFPNKRIADYRSDLTGHPDSIRMRQMQINTRCEDISFILNQIQKINSGIIKSQVSNRMDLNKIAVGGHSYGGATAITASYKDKRIRACFNLDGWISPIPKDIITEGINTPFLFLGRPSWANSDYSENYTLLKKFLNATTSPSYGKIFDRTEHLDYTDIPLFSPIVKYVLEVGNLSPSTSLPMINEIVFLFLDKELNKASNSDLEQFLSSNLISNL